MPQLNSPTHKPQLTAFSLRKLLVHNAVQRMHTKEFSFLAFLYCIFRRKLRGEGQHISRVVILWSSGCSSCVIWRKSEWADFRVHACSYKRTVDGAMTEGVPEAEIEGLVAEAQVAISSIITVIRSNALGTQSAQGSSMLQLEGYATSQRPSMTALLPSGVCSALSSVPYISH